DRPIEVGNDRDQQSFRCQELRKGFDRPMSRREMLGYAKRDDDLKAMQQRSRRRKQIGAHDLSVDLRDFQDAPFLIATDFRIVETDDVEAKLASEVRQPSGASTSDFEKVLGFGAMRKDRLKQ